MAFIITVFVGAGLYLFIPSFSNPGLQGAISCFTLMLVIFPLIALLSNSAYCNYSIFPLVLLSFFWLMFWEAKATEYFGIVNAFLKFLSILPLILYVLYGIYEIFMSSIYAFGNYFTGIFMLAAGSVVASLLRIALNFIAPIIASYRVS